MNSEVENLTDPVVGAMRIAGPRICSFSMVMVRVDQEITFKGRWYRYLD